MKILRTDKRLWTVVAAASAALAGLVARQALEQGWRLWKREAPPNNPADPRVAWKDALAWAGATGLAMGLAHVLARRGAAAGWHKVRGTMPPL